VQLILIAIACFAARQDLATSHGVPTIRSSRVVSSLNPTPTPTQDPPRQASTPLIVPSRCKDNAGGSNNNIPFSWTPARWQQLFAPESFDFEGTLLLGGVSFRRFLQQGPIRSGTAEIEVAIAMLPGTLEDTSAVFDDNVARDHQVVVPRRKVLLQNSHEREDPDKDPLGIFDLHLVFERPYKYRTDRVLVLEVRAFGNDQGDKHFQFPLDATVDTGLFRRVYSALDKRQGITDGNALVTRFDVLARAAASRPGPVSRPSEPAPGSRPTGSSGGRSPASAR
jgi:hypothetical protein